MAQFIVSSVLKKAVASLALAAVFCLVAAALIRPLMAELAFTGAEKLASRFKWAEAQARYLDAVRIDPFSARYLAGLGDFLLLQARYTGNKKPLLERAEELYRQALSLDPRNARYGLKLGGIELRGKGYAKAFEYFRAARRNDPNGYDIAYGIGASGLGVWSRLSEDDKDFTIDRLVVALRSRPYDWSALYAMAWKAAKDPGLLRRLAVVPKPGVPGPAAESKAKEFYIRRGEKRSSVSGSDWYGTTSNGKNVYKGGNMYWTGTMEAALDLPAGGATVRIRAKGQPADKAYPYMIVRLDGKDAGEVFVDSPGWKDYDFKVDTDGGVKVLSVTFANDGGNAKEDRNLFVGNAEIVKNGG